MDIHANTLTCTHLDTHTDDVDKSNLKKLGVPGLKIIYVAVGKRIALNLSQVWPGQSVYSSWFHLCIVVSMI